MTAMRKGVVTAGVLHGALLTLWLGYELTGKIYRENLRLDFTLTTGNASARAAGANQKEQSYERDAETSHGVPQNETTQGPANESAEGAAGIYAQQNLSSISGLIHGRVYYPRIARQNNWQGRVLVRFIVGTDGKTHEVALRESSGHHVLDQSALETIRDLDGLPRPPFPVPLTVPVHFKLK
jgi:TonB family protein